MSLQQIARDHSVSNIVYLLHKCKTHVDKNLKAKFQAILRYYYLSYPLKKYLELD